MRKKSHPFRFCSYLLLYIESVKWQVRIAKGVNDVLYAVVSIGGISIHVPEILVTCNQNFNNLRDQLNVVRIAQAEIICYVLSNIA